MPMNYAKTAMLLAVLTAISRGFGAAVGGKAGLVVAFAVALVMNVFSLWKSDQIVLRMFDAEEVSEATAPELFRARSRACPEGRSSDAARLCDE